MRNIFASKKGMMIAGLIIGIIAAVLQKLGNPANMGICVACFVRDTAGALGLHRASVVQYMRPEIIGFVFGALFAALAKREFKPRSGSAPIVRFILGFFAMIGALVFLGCPWRALLRLAGGDGNAIPGIAGLIAGIAIGVFFIKSGYNLGRSHKTYTSVGLIMPALMLCLLFLLLKKPVLDSGTLFFGTRGPGSQHAPLGVSLLAGGIIGVLAQRTRFCTMGAVRDVILIRDFHLLTGVAGLLGGALMANLVLQQFNPGFSNQPVAHTQQLWNFSGMLLAGLAFALAGGCPGRQLLMAGEGDGDAAVFVLGMICGAAFAHNFSAASSPDGTGACGPLFVVVGLAVCMSIGFSMRKKYDAVRGNTP